MRTLLTLMAAFALVISVGCTPEAGSPTANATAKPADTSSNSSTVAPEGDDAAAAGEFQTVSLKVPGMT